MGKTTELRRVIVKQLQAVPGPTHHMDAPPDAAYPYKTYRLSAKFPDCAQMDFSLTVDIWDRSADWKTVENIADQIEKLLNGANLPSGSLFPTFFLESRDPVSDSDKQIRHIQQQFYIHLYEEE